MKVIIELNNDKKDTVLDLLKNNNLDFEYDADILKWQIDETRKRRATSINSPSSNLSYTELKSNLAKS